MDLEAILIYLLIGALSGWLAGFIVVGGGLGLIGDIVVGIVGSFIAGWMLPVKSSSMKRRPPCGDRYAATVPHRLVRPPAPGSGR